MINIELNKIHTTARGLTQAGRVGPLDEALSVNQKKRPVTFTRTYMGSLSGDYLYQIGAGDFDPATIVKLLLQYAYDSRANFEDVSADFLNYVKTSGLEPELWRKMMSLLMATSSQITATNRVAPVTPTYVFEQLEKYRPSEKHPIFTRIMADIICSMLKPFGWILPDKAYSYRVRRPSVFPTGQDFIDIVEGANLFKALTAIAGADLGVVSAALKQGKSISPGMIGSYIAQALLRANDMTSGSLSSFRVVGAVFKQLSLMWDPETPDELMPAARIQENSSISELRSNLSVFLAVQEYTTLYHSLDPAGKFTDEEFVNVVIPLFMGALSTHSPYKLRTLADSVSFLGKHQARDYHGQPVHNILYENWTVSKEVVAFQPVRQTKTGRQKFLLPQNRPTESLSQAIEPVQRMLSIDTLVGTLVDAYELVNAALPAKAGAGTITMGFPSLTEARTGRKGFSGSTGDLVKAILSGQWKIEPKEISAKDADSAGPIAPPVQDTENWKALKAIAYDYYALIMHYSAYYAQDSVSVCSKELVGGTGKHARVPYIVWMIATHHKTPVGLSAISGGVVYSPEPLEVMGYTRAHTPTTTLEAKAVDLYQFEDTVHLWDWSSASTKLAYSAPYSTTIRGKRYEVVLAEDKLLSLGNRSQELFFLTPSMTKATTELWVSWFLSMLNQLDTELANNKGKKADSAQYTAVQGFRNHLMMKLVAALESIGGHGVGANAQALVHSAIAEEMYAQNQVDHFADLQIGVQKHRIRIWSGVTTLGLLGLMENATAEELVDLITKSDALSWYVSATQV